MDPYDIFISMCKIYVYGKKLIQSRQYQQLPVILCVKKLNEKNLLEVVENNYDYNATVVVSTLTSLKYNFLDRQWIHGYFFSDTCGNNIRWIQVLVTTFSGDTENCFVHPSLYYNITSKCPSGHFKVKMKNPISITDIDKRVLSIWSTAKVHGTNMSIYESLSPMWVNKVSCCLVEGNSNVGSEIEELLISYFKNRKFLKEGDTFTLEVPMPLHIHSLMKKTETNYSSKLVFYVLSIEGEMTKYGGYVTSNRSVLMLNSSVPSIPSNWGELGSIPPCLHSLVQKMVEVTQQKNVKSENLSNQLWNKSAVMLLIGESGCGKTELVKAISKILHMKVAWVNGLNLAGDNSTQSESNLRHAMQNVSNNSITVISHFGSITQGNQGNRDSRVSACLKEEIEKHASHNNKIIIGVESTKSNISEEEWSLFSHVFALSDMTSSERKSTLEWLISNTNIKALDDDLLNMLVYRTAGFYLGDLKELISRVYRKHIMLQSTGNLSSKNVEDIFYSELGAMQKQRSDGLGLPQVLNVKWTDVGGLEEVKKQLINIIQLPILHPQLLSNNIRSSGVVLYGPPGTGKTLLAKSVASECGLNFMSIKGPELLNMYVGQSEKNVRDVFSKATMAAPCVIFFDELDSLAPNRGKAGDSGGVMDRIVSTLLAELDGISSSNDVFVLAATNRPDLLDPALLRPGRGSLLVKVKGISFLISTHYDITVQTSQNSLIEMTPMNNFIPTYTDIRSTDLVQFEKQLYLGVCEEDSERLKILEAVFAKIPVSESVSFEDILPFIPKNLTGADFAALANDSFYRAVENVITSLPEDDAVDEEAEVFVTSDDILEAAKQLVPSVSSAQLQEYKDMQLRRE